MKKHKTICGGFSLDVQRARISSTIDHWHPGNEAPMVRLHRLGAEAVWLSPDEARLLAKLLTEAAAASESESP